MNEQLKSDFCTLCVIQACLEKENVGSGSIEHVEGEAK